MTRQAVLFFFWCVSLWVTGVLLEVDVFYTLAAIGIGTELVSLVLLLNSAAGLSIERRHVSSARQGNEVTMELTLRSAHRLSQGAMLIRDSNPACGEEGAPRIWLSGLRQGHDIILTYEFTAVERGEHQLGPVEIVAADPLGFFQRRRHLRCPGEIAILPRWEKISLLPFNSRQRSYLVGIERTTVEGEGQEFFGVREYRYGDSMRRVHWASSARLSRPMVRQFENESRPNISLFVDTVPREASGAEPEFTSLDRCSAVAASLAMHVLETGSRIACYAPGQERTYVDLQGGNAQQQMVMRFLAGLEEDPDGSRASGLREAMGHLTGGSTLVVVLSSLDAEVVATLSVFSYSGGAAVVFLLDAEDREAHVKRKPRRWRSVDEADSGPGIEQYVEGLKALGVPVASVGEVGTLDQSIQAWLR